MRWSGQQIGVVDGDALPGMGRLDNLVRSVQTPEFAGITFHEVLAKSALNHVPGESKALPFGWTINPYRGCSHQCVFCFARNTHTFLDFDAGRDFDTQIVVKINIAEVLQRELGRPSWQRPHVALGTNTDPYQRAEGRYRLMPGIVAALAASRTPFSVLTKGTLLRRDLPLLQEAAQHVPVQLAMTIDVADPQLRASLEPGTPTTEARLATVRAATDAGFDVSVLVMPVLPYLTDSIAHLDRLLGMIEEAGATRVAYTALHLRPGAREWYLGWLGREHPELLPRYREMYGGGSYPPREYRAWLARRITPLLCAHGLDRRPTMDPATGTPTTDGSSPRFAAEEYATGHEMPSAGLIAAELSPAMAAALQPTLF
ncbi:Rv2578c family radical SAM protein [Pseudolysinimonas kribbensis]|uniref:Rv2578c family radical SAM protein n=1 Tax=Pseudolysinimonas kribbensis TaxID=433641 RepID=UPI0031D87974